MKKTLIVTVSVALFSSTSPAGTLAPVSSEKSDQQICKAGDPVWAGQALARVGYDTVINQGTVFITVFALPVLPVDETIQSAALTVNVVKPQGVFGGEADWNVDVYGVRAAEKNTVLSSDFFEGDADANATKVIDNFIAVSGGTPAATGPHDSGQNAAFGAWLQTLYNDNQPIQPYVFIRLNSDVPFDSYKNVRNPEIQVASRYLQIGTADNKEPNSAPMLTIVTGAAK